MADLRLEHGGAGVTRGKGGLDAIEDEELRRTLTSWARLIEFIVKVEEQEETCFNEAMLPFLRAEARVAQIAQTLSGGGPNAGGMGNSMYGDVDWWPEERDLRPLLVSDAFQNLVVHKLWIQTDILRSYERFSGQLQELIERLEARSS